ncbi:methyl-accepting chemotaxis protein [Aeromonas veronii]|uniref:methyl-accepting chemotaxis protein n=1 Tax=Aeromonas veronii TaxID=654 RepID=UPI003EC90FD0
MIKLSLKNKILTLVTILLSISIITLSWISYSTQKTIILNDNNEQAIRLGEQQAESISDWLLARIDIMKALSTKLDGDLVKPLQQAKDSGRLAMAYFGDQDGKMISDDPSRDFSNYDPRSRPWYQQAKNSAGISVTKPYVDAQDNSLVITIALALPTGVVAGDLSITTMVNDINKMSLPADGFAVLLHNDGTVIAHKDHMKVMKPITEIDDELSIGLLSQKAQAGEMISVFFESEGRPKLVAITKIPNTDWSLLIVLDKETLEAPLISLLITQLILALVIIIVSIVAISLLTKALLGPLVKVTYALARIADGSGDLTQRITIDTRDEVGELANSFNRFVSSQHKLISHIRALASELDTDAEHGLVSSNMAVCKLQRQQQEVTMVATAVTEMASATQEIANNTENTATAAHQSAKGSEDGKRLVNQTRQSINGLASEVTQATDVISELNRHAQNISSILATIQGIAEQTNLLALNAAIEAARAGEQGRGFAVVADEVRVLSKRTQDSTLEIHSTIDILQQTTTKAVELMQRSQRSVATSVDDADSAVQALEEITQAVNLISDMAGQIATAAEEQSHVTVEITKNTTTIKDVTDEMTAAALRDLEQAKVLKDRAQELNAQVATFIL